MHLLGHANEEMSMKYIHICSNDAINKGSQMRNTVAMPLPTGLGVSLENAYTEKLL